MCSHKMCTDVYIKCVLMCTDVHCVRMGSLDEKENHESGLYPVVATINKSK